MCDAPNAVLLWLQVVEQARDVVIHDTQLETAVVGEDILLTPEAASSRPDQRSQSLLSAGIVSYNPRTSCCRCDL